ncbi:lipopolysaccharide biosynthesis protein [Alicycliphilus denitrificans]|uniref:lipopolysaccharide biosynthesis protein n=1 Tax=Alicycliphilus denitrificans TaxID=179636 RepID=UPI003851262B
MRAYFLKLHQKIICFSKRPFVLNVLTLVTGTAASQAITMAFMPLITRIYGPEEYGIQGVFITVAGVMATIAALTYPAAIILPKTDGDAMGIVHLSICVSIAMSLFAAVLLFICGDEILSFLRAKEILAFMYLIPVAMVVSVFGNVTGQWLIRKKAFLLTAKVTALQSLTINFFKVGLGVVNSTATTLIVINVFGGVLSAGMMAFGYRKIHVLEKRPIEKPKRQLNISSIAKKYYDFPLLRAPQVFINAISHNLPVLMFSMYFGPASVGFYLIAFSVLGAPSIIISGSVMQVFYPRINEAIQRGEDVRKLIIKATLGLTLAGAPAFLIVIFAGPVIFEFILGSEWRMAGAYAQWLSVWIFFQYINKPAVAAIPALRIQRGLLVYEIFSAFAKVLAIFIGYVIYNSDIVAVAIFSVFGAVMYAVLILWVVALSSDVNTARKI